MGAGGGLARPTDVEPRTPTGFSPLDELLAGGLRRGDVLLIGGKPGVGKTVLAWQWARTMAAAGLAVTYVSRRERSADLARRALVAGDTSALPDVGSAGGRHRSGAPTVVESRRCDGPDLVDGLVDGLLGRPLDGPVDARRDRSSTVPDVLVLDDHDATPTWRLGTLARRAHCAVVAVVPCNGAGLAARRTRLHHLGCTPDELHDADVVLVLNDKAPIVSCAHLALDRREVGALTDRTVLSIEKNRGGLADVHLEFRRDFDRARFEPAGVWVGERLYDERATDH